MMISAAQLRAARGLLDWTRTELAEAAKISPETVKNIEHGIFRPQEETAGRIIKAFTEHDVMFTEDDGVKLKKDSVIRFEGSEGFKKFMDDVYEVTKKNLEEINSGKSICLSVSDDGLFIKHLGDYFDMHARRMNAIGIVKMKILTKDKPTFYLQEETPETSYREYRLFTQQNVGNVPFYVYGDKLAIMIFDKDDVSIIAISSALAAKAYREQFDVLWQAATPLDKSQDPRIKKPKKASVK
jgi:hypothetical protein